MTDPISNYSASIDVERAHPTLDRDAPMPKAEFAQITGAYSFANNDYVECQLVLEDGKSKCGQSHGRGWIMRRTDGVEGYIGHDCARDHFGAEHQAFAAETARARRDIRIAQYKARLDGIIADTAREARFLNGVHRAERIRLRVRSLLNRLPGTVKLPLGDMRRNGGSGVTVEFLSVVRDEDKDGVEYDRNVWSPVLIGSVRGADALDLSLAEEMKQGFETAAEALRRAQSEQISGEVQLRSVLRQIDAADGFEARLDELEQALSAFLQPDNLRQLVWFGKDYAEQTEIVSAVLELSGLPFGSSATKTAHTRWREELKAANGGKTFRVP